MAQRIGPPGTARLAISGSYGGTGWANVFWCSLAGGTTASQAGFDEFTTKFGDLYATTWRDEFSAGNTILQCQGVLFQSPTAVLHSLHGMNVPGLVSGAFVSDSAASWVISWLSNAYWRGGKPRTYMPNVQESYTDSSDHRLTTAATASLKTKAVNFHVAINALSAAGITNTAHGFVKFFQGGTLLTPGVFYAISAPTIHPRLGTQRRRLGAWIP